LPAAGCRMEPTTGRYARSIERLSRHCFFNLVDVGT
jgi:hypothetical protein